ncbi:MAG: AAA family ATPase [Acidimicrobiia bacterium]
MSDLAPPPPAVTPMFHVPTPDDRAPKTRKKMLFFDRIKVLMIIAIILFFAMAKMRSDLPVLSLEEVARNQLQAKQWLLWLALAELIRQVHYGISEHSAKYHGFWTKKIWGGWDRRMSKLDPWMRFRLGRLCKALFLATLFVFYLAAAWGIPFFDALAEAPSRLWNKAFSPATQLPFLVNIMMSLSLSVGSIVFLYWFMAKGGYETLLPDEVDTRFSDGFGQDKVLDKVKENLVFLEKPQEIESKGGYVPSGVLLWGPPGTGKTLIAKAVAGETGRPYVFVEPGAFNQMFMGVGVLKVRAVFRKLRKLALRHGGVIVFFDEADSLGNRGLETGGQPGGVGGGAGNQAFEMPHMCNGLHYVSHGTASTVQTAWLNDLRAQRAADAAAEPRKVNVKQIIMGMGGGSGVIQALLTQLSGLEKPQGFLWRRVRKFLSMPSKKPPKYRILMMMATNLPQALDAALLRPGRIDRIYKVDYPSLEGRKRTYEGYLDKVQHRITAEQVDRITLMSPNASGAVIKDVVNEALIIAMRDGRDTVSWPDLLKAKQMKTHGVPDDVHTVALERHNVALHEASHAVAMYRLKKRETIDVATIEPRGPVGGFVAPVPLEEEGFPWKHLQEDEIITFLASLAGERHFYDGDNSVGVGGDLRASTLIMSSMLGGAAMGDSLVSRWAMGGNGPAGGPKFFHEIDANLKRLLERASALIAADERWVMAIAHALEQHYTITGEDIEAIFNGGVGPIVDGRWYQTEEFVSAYRAYHAAALRAHQAQGRFDAELPLPPVAIAASSTPATVMFGAALPPPPPAVG